MKETDKEIIENGENDIESEIEINGMKFKCSWETDDNDEGQLVAKRNRLLSNPKMRFFYEKGGEVCHGRMFIKTMHTL